MGLDEQILVQMLEQGFVLVIVIFNEFVVSEDFIQLFLLFLRGKRGPKVHFSGLFPGLAILLIFELDVALHHFLQHVLNKHIVGGDGVGQEPVLFGVDPPL